MRRFTPIIRVTCVIMCFLLVTSIFASCKKEVEEVVATTTESMTESTTEATTEPTTETTTETTTVSTTAKPKPTYKDEVDANFPYTLCSYTTNYKTSQKDRSVNLQVASNKINNLVIPSGATFSFNGTVGKRTKANGFREAIVFNAGKEEKGIGGGVCQVSSTVFQTALRSNFKIVERHPHSLKVHYVPTGCDATVYYGSQDFRFRNDFPCNIKIKMSCSGGKLTCTILADQNVNFGNIRIKVTGPQNNCTLVRYCNGAENYRTKSYYKNGTNSNVNVDINNKPNDGATVPPTTTTTTVPATQPPTTLPSTTAPTTKPSTTESTTKAETTKPETTTETQTQPPEETGTTQNSNNESQTSNG